ncbi:acyl-ACP desaturase [Polaribacter sp.]|jgi:acyl-[acyl-carrier-protein] desaturase|nr:acyl-ACP desaturase [Polaribacter sp.]MDA9976494.1 acyl-ACP desaturase [Polaribacter sp.]MDB9777860.1 acyl-ACP desaturase [Polaribacter sp.]MDB9887296.1 acyl-ACP desaturase [Polaribacter sp.]MDC0085968.1 acyl-ACP desaturase [Polaribacter sp.]
MSIQNIRKEVMKTLEKNIDTFVDKFLIPAEKIWQPTDFLPNSQKDTFIDEIKEIQELSKDLSDDFWVVLVGDTITEEALPTYESWLLDIDGVSQQPDNGWAKWIRSWTAEENRHGDTLNKYLYLSGRVNMREVEITTQHLISDGFDIGTASDPYKNFVYTSFQELATYISHNNVAKIARKKGHKALAKMSKIIAGDEMRHHVAYTEFVRQIFAIDPNEMMLAFQHMMKHKIVMPALHLRESFSEKGSLFTDFSTVAQRAGVYTGFDYIDILRKLNAAWEIEKITGLTAEAEKARDYLLKLPDRMYRITERIVIPKTKFQFKWLNPI